MIKRILPWVVILFVAGALLALILMQKVPVAQSFQKADGTVVKFLDVTYGTNQTIVRGSSFRQWLYKVLPKPVKSWSGATVLKFATAQTNVPTFWVLETKPKEDNAPQASGPTRTDQLMRLVDEYGCEFNPEGWSMGTSGVDRNGTIAYYAIESGDPHGRIVGLCFYDTPEKTHRLGCFMIPGAVMANVPAPAQPAAAAKQEGEFTFQLMSLVTGLKSAPYAYRVPWQIANAFTQATLKIASNGVPVPNWFPTSVRVTDKRGKKMAIRIQHSGSKDGNDALNFEGALDPAKGPFKLRFEFTHYEGFAPDELVTVKDVPFAADSEILSPGLRVEVKGRRLLLEKIYGASAERPYQYYQTSQPLLQVRLEPADDSVRMLLEHAMDENGKEMARWGSGPAGDGKYCFSFAPKTKSKTMTLTFAVYENRYAEFEAMPMVYQTNRVGK